MKYFLRILRTIENKPIPPCAMAPRECASLKLVIPQSALWMHFLSAVALGGPWTGVLQVCTPGVESLYEHRGP